MAKQQLTQEQKQGLNIRRLQQIGLLALPIEAMEQRIKDEISRNPALESDEPLHEPQPEEEPLNEAPAEEHDDDLLPEERDEDYYGDPTYQYYNESDTDNYRENNFTGDRNLLSDYLREQIPSLNLTEREALIADLVIGNIAEDGYLRATNREISDWLVFNGAPEMSDSEISAVISKVQTLDPVGVAGRNLQEVLLLQLERMAPSEAVTVAKEIVTHHLDDFASRRFAKIEEEKGWSEELVAEAVALIKTLNPKPGNGFGSDFDAIANRIIPDFLVHVVGDDLVVSINDDDFLPNLRVSPAYLALSKEKLSQNRKKRSEQQFIRKQVSHASWFIDMIERRRNTLLHTMECIVSMQEDYFRSGEPQDMKPLILKDIADRVGYDVSTISRISNEKYVETDFGIYSVKHFFSEGVPDKWGNPVATHYLKHLLVELIAAEDKRHPLTDERLAQKFDELGYPIARRTVAKYRDSLLIPPASKRKIVE